MIIYRLVPKPGCERYTVDVGWMPYRSYFATVVDFGWDPVTDPGNEPERVRLGFTAPILDPLDVLAVVERYADIPADLTGRLRDDQAGHPRSRGPVA